MSKKLVIDINQCEQCDECTVKCAYFYQPENTEHGILALREQVYFQLVCRRCENPCCIAACRFEALERQDDGVLKRHNMRCVSCKCCSYACPFGTIYPETVPFFASRCDYCLSSTEDQPACEFSCIKKAIAYREVDETAGDGIHVLNDHLAVYAPHWDKKDV